MVVFKVLCFAECQAVRCILPWDPEDVGEQADHAGELGRDGSSYTFGLTADATLQCLWLYSCCSLGKLL